MKIGIVLPANILHAPYLQYYIDILEDENINYHVIYWNKINLRESNKKCTAFNYRCNYNASKYKKIIGYFYFSRFVIKKIKKEKYDKLIILVPQLALFLEGFLKKQFKNNYILDIRDYSSFLKLNNKLKRVINNSSMTVISSKGYKTWLPTGKQYVISHNINLHALIENSHIEPPQFNDKNKYVISNIGSIRHFMVNKKVINQFENSEFYNLHYIGRGVCEKDLQQYCHDRKIKNVVFYGKYEKNDELKFYIQSDLINLIQPKDSIGPKTAMANRIYNACISKRPVIVSDGTYMSKIVKKYNLGIIVDIDKDDLPHEIKIYLEKKFDRNIFLTGCNSFIEEVQKEERIFHEKVRGFLRRPL